MGLRSPRVPFSQMNDQQSDQYARNVPVVPDPNSTGSDQLKNGAVTEPKLADDAVSTRALNDEAVTNAKLRLSTACSVIGRPTNSPGAPSDISVGSNNQFLVRRSNQLIADTLLDTDIPASIARDTGVAAAILAHEAALDPHPGYLTQAEGDARYTRPDANTFTATLTGCTATITDTAYWRRVGDQVWIEFQEGLFGTSNTTAATLTGLPAGLIPARPQNLLGRVMDNGVTAIAVAQVRTDGVIELWSSLTSLTFTNSGTKGIGRGTFTYNLT